MKDLRECSGPPEPGGRTPPAGRVLDLAREWMELRRLGLAQDEILLRLGLPPGEAEGLLRVLTEAHEMAGLHVKEKLTQQEIASRKRVARGTVISRLKLAEEVGIVQAFLTPPVAGDSRA